MKKPVPFCSFGGYRSFCGAWWNDLVHYAFGVSWLNRWSRLDDEPLWRTVRLRRPGWVADIHNYWLRARYGWAPRDTWSLDTYMNGVLAGALLHLVERKAGTPAGYPLHGDELFACDHEVETDHGRWEADVRRWAKAFSEDPDDVEIYDKPDYAAHNAEETRRRDAIHQALREMEPWWDALWD